MTWTTDAFGVHWLHGKHCAIWIDIRPEYCDRGNFLAHLAVRDRRKVHIDEADLWPRFYFDLDRAKLECEAWMEKRREAFDQDISRSVSRRLTFMLDKD